MGATQQGSAAEKTAADATDAADAANAVHERGKREFTQLFSSTRRGAHLARVSATQHLAAWGYETGSAALVVSELAANAVAHGHAPGRDFLLRLAVEPDRPAILRIEVSDACAERRPPSHPRLPDDDAENGRGLFLVQAFAVNWGVVEQVPGKTVWAVLDLFSGGLSGEGGAQDGSEHWT
ncbi:ATP-binding protein [Streptomyces sp. H27-D2]|uniref:ATP-binding protein n=1 Tax=Streptomyces sp. H27-D2 TaxID=3046304 RepID=UPI002DBCCE9E|nr:ATP-binding protein [Streptomyces sp. H27-D2]MEC4014960.1 ATP-binding protein [Streptomyces sp. H27-D2]